MSICRTCGQKLETTDGIAKAEKLVAALFKIRSLTFRGQGDHLVAALACDAVREYDEPVPDTGTP